MLVLLHSNTEIIRMTEMLAGKSTWRSSRPNSCLKLSYCQPNIRSTITSSCQVPQTSSNGAPSLVNLLLCHTTLPQSPRTPKLKFASLPPCSTICQHKEEMSSLYLLFKQLVIFLEGHLNSRPVNNRIQSTK